MKDILSRLDYLKNEKQKKELLSKELNKSNEKDNLSEKNNFNQKYNSSRYYNQDYLNKSIYFSRPSMLKLNELIKDYGFFQKRPLIEEDSGKEDNIDEETNQTIPSLNKVSKYIFDPHTIMIVNDINFFPREAKPSLIITGIEDWVKEKHIKYFLEGIPNYNNNYYNNIDLSTIKFFKDNQQKTCAYIYPMKFKILETIFNFFHNPIKKYIPTLNSKNEKMEILASFNLLELTKSYWYGIILRNLPKNCTSESIYNFCDGYIKDGINYCLNPIIVDEISCSLVVCKSLEYAEKLCSILNNYDITKNRILLAHFHPAICKIRKNINNESGDKMFSKTGYLFKENIEQSERCLKNAEYFVKINKKQQINIDKSKKNEDSDNKNNKLNDKNLLQIPENSNSNNKDLNLKKNNYINKDDSLIESIMSILKINKSKDNIKNPVITTIKSSDNIFKNNEINKQISDDSNIQKENNTNNETNILTNNNEIKSSPNIENTKNNIKDNNYNKEDKPTTQNNEILINSEKNKILNTNSNNTTLENNNTINTNQSLLNSVNPILLQNSNLNQNNILANDIKYNNIFQEPGEIYDSKNINIDPLSNFSKKDIDYYTYNMGSESFYERKEEELRRKSKRFNNSYYRDNNYKHLKYYNNNFQKYNNRNKSPYRNYKKREYNNQNYYEKYERGRINEDEDSSETELLDKYNNRSHERSREAERRNVRYEKYEKKEYEKKEYKKSESIISGKQNINYNYKEPKDYRDKEIINYKNNYKEDYHPKIYQKESYHRDNSKIYEDYSTNYSTNKDINDTKNRTFSNSFQEKNISRFTHNNESYHQKYSFNQNRERDYYSKNKLNTDNFENKNSEKYRIRDNYPEKEINNYYKNKNHNYSQEINRERSRDDRDRYKNFKSGERAPIRKSSSQRKNSASYDYHHYSNNSNIHSKKN